MQMSRRCAQIRSHMVSLKMPHWRSKTVESHGLDRSLTFQRECFQNRASWHGHWLTPALIDCHTHLVFGGDRAAEFEQRLNGVSYEEIARAGGGIRTTVQATRSATKESLTETARLRADSLLSEGVATIEVKSGYGLDFDTELTMLSAARALDDGTPRFDFDDFSRCALRSL